MYIVYIVFSNKKDILKVSIPYFKKDFLERYEWTILRMVRSTCRRGPHLCPCSPQLQEMLVERTTGVNGPLTCYRCQQGYTSFLE